MSADSCADERPRIGEDGVRRIAELAHLRVEDEQFPAFAEHFERMLDFVEKLNEVDVTGVEPDIHCERNADLREDTLREPSTPGGPLDRDRVMENAPDHEGPYFTTPKVV